MKVNHPNEQKTNKTKLKFALHCSTNFHNATAAFIWKQDRASLYAFRINEDLSKTKNE